MTFRAANVTGVTIEGALQGVSYRQFGGEAEQSPTTNNIASLWKLPPSNGRVTPDAKGGHSVVVVMGVPHMEQRMLNVPIR